MLQLFLYSAQNRLNGFTLRCEICDLFACVLHKLFLLLRLCFHNGCNLGQFLLFLCALFATALRLCALRECERLRMNSGSNNTQSTFTNGQTHTQTQTAGRTACFSVHLLQLQLAGADQWSLFALLLYNTHIDRQTDRRNVKVYKTMNDEVISVSRYACVYDCMCMCVCVSCVYVSPYLCHRLVLHFPHHAVLLFLLPLLTLSPLTCRQLPKQIKIIHGQLRCM